MQTIKVQYISDDKGLTTGVYIPINEWNTLKQKYKELESVSIEVPEWHKEIVLQRLNDYYIRHITALDFENTMDDIEKSI